MRSEKHRSGLIRGGAVAVFAALALAACGTTVPQTSTVYSNSAGGVNAGLGQATTLDPAGTTADQPGTTVPGGSAAQAASEPGVATSTQSGSGPATVTGTSGTPVTIAGSVGTRGKSSATSGAHPTAKSSGATKTTGEKKGTTPKSSAPATAPGLSGQGFTATTISIGVSTVSNSQSVLGTYGITGLDPGDQKAQMQAMADTVNSQGGILGRKLVLVFYDWDANQLVTDENAADDAACSAWTQDNHVFAVLFATDLSDELLQCLSAAKTPLIDGGGLDYPHYYSDVYAKYPDFIYLGSTVGELFDQIVVKRLVARGFFDPWNTSNSTAGNATTNPVKVGLMTSDDANGDNVIASYTAQLAKIGLKLTDTVKCPLTVDGAESCSASAELKFRTDGITHVIEPIGAFLGDASSQGYYPRYFIGFEARALAELYPKALVGAVAEGYQPEQDVEAAQTPADPTPATTACKQIMTAAQQDYSKPETLWSMEITCDVVNFFKAALTASGSLTPAGLISGFESIGSSMQTAETWASKLGPGPMGHASAVAVRDLAFGTDCSCFSYTSTTNYGAE